MTQGRSPRFWREVFQLSFLAVLLGTAILFFWTTPRFAATAALGWVLATLLSPITGYFAARGYPRHRVAFYILSVSCALTGWITLWGLQFGLSEWEHLQSRAQGAYAALLGFARNLEELLWHLYPGLHSFSLISKLQRWKEEWRSWTTHYGANSVQSALELVLIIPFVSYFYLTQAASIRRGFFQLIPNRYFESIYILSTEIGQSITNYIRAKLLEAILVGLMITLGLSVLRIPHAWALGLFAGGTNLLPYVGPILGAIPALLMADSPTLTGAIVGVVVIANLVDSLLVFPLLVGKLVNLHPFILLWVVVIGNHYSGLVGMLVSVPLASALKIVAQEIYRALYESRLSQAALAEQVQFEEST